MLRRHRHGLTVVSRYTAPPGKGCKIIGKASSLGEEVYVLKGAYYNQAGRIISHPGSYMFNALVPNMAASRPTSPCASSAAAASRTGSCRST